jgi:hypothetical protein
MGASRQMTYAPPPSNDASAGPDDVLLQRTNGRNIAPVEIKPAGTIRLIEGDVRCRKIRFQALLIKPVADCSWERQSCRLLG